MESPTSVQLVPSHCSATATTAVPAEFTPPAAIAAVLVPAPPPPSPATI